MKRFLCPTRGPESWKEGLADPAKQWKRGFSAWSLAHTWEAASGFPDEVSALLASDAELAGTELLVAIPEYRVSLPGGAGPSQTDLFCLGRTANGLAGISVEGKVAESFGETLDAWEKDASPGKKVRLQYLTQTLGLQAKPPGTVRYQLLHRTASAVIEAKHFLARNAVMVVHHFGRVGDLPKSFADFAAFVGLFGRLAEPGRLLVLGEPGSVRLSVGWANGNLA